MIHRSFLVFIGQTDDGDDDDDDDDDDDEDDEDDDDENIEHGVKCTHLYHFTYKSHINTNPRHTYIRRPTHIVY